MDNLKKGDYGRFNFKLTKKGKTTGLDLMARVIDFDEKYVHLRDNDDLEYLPRRQDIRSFNGEHTVPEETLKQ